MSGPAVQKWRNINWNLLKDNKYIYIYLCKNSKTMKLIW